MDPHIKKSKTRKIVTYYGGSWEDRQECKVRVNGNLSPNGKMIKYPAEMIHRRQTTLAIRHSEHRSYFRGCEVVEDRVDMDSFTV